MHEQPDPDPDVTADPAARQDPALREGQQGGAVRPGIEEDACHGAGALLEGRFEFIECVGAGGMSAVYKALDRRKPAVDALDRHIAVKVLNPRFRADPKRLKALQQEVECCQRLVHPNIVRVYEFYRDGLTAYMTMEYLLGAPLTARIRSERFTGMSAHEARPIINAMGQALAYAHSRGIVHCDFKPANVFLTKAGEVKLIDFGLARPFAQGQDAATEADVEFRPLGAISPAYASPEMLEGQEPDPRDDVYGLACTAYELLTGVHPFGYRSATEARKAGLTVERHEGLSYKQRQALCGALAFERGERTPSVKGFLKEFNEELWRVQPSYLTAGAAACLLVAIGGMIGLLSSRPEPRLVGPSEGSAGAGAMTESKPGLATAPLAEIVSVESGRPSALALDHADVIPPSTRVLKQTVPSGTINPEAKATMSRAPGPRVAGLLARAERQMETKHLTTPVGDAAFESYEQVLKLIPGHERALEGIARIKDEYKLWAEVDEHRGNWERAEASLKKALAIDPEDAMLPVALRALREIRKRAQKKGGREVQEQEPHQLARPEIVRPKEKHGTQVNVRALTTPNQAGGEIIITEQECSEDPQGNFAVSTAVNQAIRYTGCAVKSNHDRLAIEWNNGTVSAHSLTEFAPSEAVFGWHSSPEEARSADPMARPVSRFEEFERRMGIRR